MNIRWLNGTAERSWDKAATELNAQLDREGVRPGQVVAVYARPAGHSMGGMVLTALTSTQLPASSMAPVQLRVSVDDSASLSWAQLFMRAAREVGALAGEGMGLVGVTASSGADGARAVLVISAPLVGNASAPRAAPRLVSAGEATAARAAIALQAQLRAVSVRRGQLLAVHAREGDAARGEPAVMLDALVDTALPDRGPLVLMAETARAQLGEDARVEAATWEELNAKLARRLARLPLGRLADVVSVSASRAGGEGRAMLQAWWTGDVQPAAVKGDV